MSTKNKERIGFYFIFEIFGYIENKLEIFTKLLKPQNWASLYEVVFYCKFGKKMTQKWKQLQISI